MVRTGQPGLMVAHVRLGARAVRLGEQETVRVLAEADEQRRNPCQHDQLFLVPPEAAEKRQDGGVDAPQLPRGGRGLGGHEAVLRLVRVPRFELHPGHVARDREGARERELPPVVERREAGCLQSAPTSPPLSSLLPQCVNAPLPSGAPSSLYVAVRRASVERKEDAPPHCWDGRKHFPLFDL